MDTAAAEDYNQFIKVVEVHNFKALGEKMHPERDAEFLNVVFSGVKFHDFVSCCQCIRYKYTSF